MPHFSRFRGYVIYMYFREHPPPHFHVRYPGGEAIIDIGTMQMTGGRLPPFIRRSLTDWGAQHRERLLDNWQRVMQHEPLLWIDPPE